MSREQNPSSAKAGRGVRSQTLERALDVLQLLSDGKQWTSRQISEELGLHRSIIYRILRTLESYSLVARSTEGGFRLGLGMSALAKSGMGSLEIEIDRLLQELSNVTSATAIFCAAQRDDAVVLASTRPSRRPASVAVRTGSRFPLSASAPGLAILSLRPRSESEPDEAALARQTGFVHTKGEPFVGLEALSAPVMLPDGQASSLSLLFALGDGDVPSYVRELRTYCDRLVAPADSWQF